MKAVVQRVIGASVTLRESGEKRAISEGLTVLLGVGHEDTERDSAWLADKIVDLRIFGDDDGKMNRSLADLLSPQMLIVSQFTLLGNSRKGRRPSFIDAAPPSVAIPLYQRFIGCVAARGVHVETGEFGADMLVEIANDGPVTLIVDSPGRS